jgi:hypothetical protein
MPLDISMTNEEKIVVTAAPVTATGKPASVDGDVLFVVSAGTCTINRLSPTSVEVVSGDVAGDSTVDVSADADLGAGVVTITDVVTAHVNAALATGLGLSAAVPVPK